MGVRWLEELNNTNSAVLGKVRHQPAPLLNSHHSPLPVTPPRCVATSPPELLSLLAWVQAGRYRRLVFKHLTEPLTTNALRQRILSEHDRIGRLAVRLDISRLVVVGTGRPMSAMHQGAVMEGSWGSEATIVPDADAALALLRAELAPGDVVLVKASNAAGLGALAEALAEDRG